MSAQVDPEQARLVADAFLDAAREPGHPLVHAAYASLGEQTDALFARCRRWVRVVFTRCDEPYASAAELSESVRRHHLLEMVPARCDRYRRHPLLDTSVGGTYDRLRAVHDIVSHGWNRLGFDRDGEYTAWLIEDRLYTGIARQALATELHAEHSVRWTTGEIADHKAVLLEPELVGASRLPTR